MQRICLAALITTIVSALPAAAQSVADLCTGRAPCSLVETKSAGKDAQGRALTVVEINLGEQNDDGFKCRPYRREFWLRVDGVAQPQRILELCNDGYGASGVGEDDITIKANLLEHHQMGGSAWRWSVGYSIQLSPLRVLDEAHCSYHNIAPGFTAYTWDWTRFAGERRWSPKACNTKPADDDVEVGCDSGKVLRSYIPIAQLEGAFERVGRRLHLGTCSTAIDESGQRGFLLHGTGRANGTELRALLISKRDLVVTVTDTRFITGAASWLNEDHVELWLGDYHADLACPGERNNLRQWGIGLDGKINAAHGNPRTGPRLVARMQRTVNGRQQVTLHLLLPDDVTGITLAYSKAENGRQSRLVATSKLDRADGTTIGGSLRVDPKGVHCGERNGQLDLIDTGLPALLGAK